MDDKSKASVKKMAEMLRKGATMLAQACPYCGSPLMKQDDTVYCTTCDRVISSTKSNERDMTADDKTTVIGLRETLLRKLRVLGEMLESETDIDVLIRLGNLIFVLLQALKQLEQS